MSETMRVQTLEALQGQFTHIDQKRLHELDVLEANTSPYMPTIGAEIEVTWTSVFPQSAARVFREGTTWKNMTDQELEAFNTLCSALDTEVLPLYESTQRAGIPKGKDAYWEFAHAPCKSYQTLADEIGLLMKPSVGLIPTEQELSMHVTLGGIEVVHGGPHMILTGLELARGTTGDRIRKAIVPRLDSLDRGWARKAAQGLYTRAPGELAGTNCGFEMRSLVANTSEQVRDTMRTAQMLGAALLGSRAVRSGDDGYKTRHLRLNWRQFITSLKSAFYAAQIDIGQQWLAPYEKAEPWASLANFIDGDSRHYEETRDKLRAVIDDVVEDTEECLLS